VSGFAHDGGQEACMKDRMIVLLILVLSARTAQARDARQDERELLRTEATLCAAFEHGDAATLRRGLDPTFTLTDSHGQVTGFERNVEDVARRDPAYDVFRNHDQRVRLYGDAAVVTGITTVKGRSGKDAFAADFQYTDTWVRGADGWKIVASHASRLEK
jgi:ketosteroid isomerase-like protein